MQEHDCIKDQAREKFESSFLIEVIGVMRYSLVHESLEGPSSHDAMLEEEAKDK